MYAVLFLPIRIRLSTGSLSEPVISEKDYKGFIIGIERDNLPIINPDVDTMIETGDLLWVIGTRAMADELLLSGVLEINNDNY